MIGVLGGHLGFSENDDNALEVSGVVGVGGMVSIVLESQRMVGMESGEQ